MNWTIDSSTLPDYLSVITAGEVTYQDYVSMWNAIFSHAGWRPGGRVFFDNRGLDKVEAAQNLTERAANFFLSREKELGPARVAIFSGRSDNFKYARQFRYALSSKSSPVSLHMFLEREEALKWLMRSANSDPSEKAAQQT